MAKPKQQSGGGGVADRRRASRSKGTSRAGRAVADTSWANPVDEPLREVLDALRDRVTQFRAQTPRPTPHAWDVFWLALGDDLEVALEAANARVFQRWLASLNGQPPKRRRGRPRTRPVRSLLMAPPPRQRGRRPLYDDIPAIVAQVLARLSEAARDGRRLPQRLALADVLLDEDITLDPAKQGKFEEWLRHHEEKKGSARSARAAAVRSVEGARFPTLARRISRAVTGRRPRK